MILGWKELFKRRVKVVAFTVAFGVAKVLHFQMQQYRELFTTSLAN